MQKHDVSGHFLFFFFFLPLLLDKPSSGTLAPFTATLRSICSWETVAFELHASPKKKKKKTKMSSITYLAFASLLESVFAPVAGSSEGLRTNGSCKTQRCCVRSHGTSRRAYPKAGNGFQVRKTQLFKEATKEKVRSYWARTRSMIGGLQS